MLLNRTSLGFALSVFRKETGDEELRLPNTILFLCEEVEDDIIYEGQVAFLYGPFEDTYMGHKRRVYASSLWDVSKDDVLYTLLSADHNPLRDMKRDEFLILTEFAPVVDDYMWNLLIDDKVLRLLDRMILPLFLESHNAPA